MAKKIDLDRLAEFKALENAMIADNYSSSKTYALGDYVYYSGTLYKCTTAITTAEAWTSGHWTAAKLADDLTSQTEKIDDISDNVFNGNIEIQNFDRSLSGGGSTSQSIAFSNHNNTYTLDGLCPAGTQASVYWWGLLSKPQITRAYSTASSSTFMNFAKNISVKANRVYKVTPILESGVLIGDSITIEAYNTSNESLNLECRIGQIGYIYPKADGNINLVIKVAHECGFSNAVITVEVEEVKEVADYSRLFVKGGYISLANNTADITSVVENSDYGYLVVPCEAGDKFVVASFGQSSPRRWGFVDTNGNVLSKAEAITGQRDNRYLDFTELVAPDFACYLVCNHRYYAELGYSPVCIRLSNDQAENKLAKANHTIPSNPNYAWKRQIVAAYDKYLAKLDGGKLYRSSDCGLTWNSGVDVSEVGIIRSYHMYATGTLAFFTETKAYYIENWTTYSEASCYEADGVTAYVPATYDNFYTIFDVAERKFIGNQDMYVFGNYVVNGEGTTRALLWYSIDNGHTYRIAYEFNLNDTYAARHVHTAVYYAKEDIFIVCTGDTNATECWVLGFTYDTSNDVWSITELGGSSRQYKWAYLSIWGDEMYFSYDNTPGSICKCKYADIGDTSKHETVLDGTTADAICCTIGKRGDMIVTQSHYRSTGGANPVFALNANYDCRKIYYSSNRKDFAEIFVDPQIMDSYTSFSGFLPITADGHFICGCHGGGGTEGWNKTPSVYLDDYVRLAGYNDAFKPL